MKTIAIKSIRTCYRVRNRSFAALMSTKLANRPKMASALAALALDLILFAGFAVLTGIPMALAGMPWYMALFIQLVVWGLLDSAACMAVRIAETKAAGSYLTLWQDQEGADE